MGRITSNSSVGYCGKDLIRYYILFYDFISNKDFHLLLSYLSGIISNVKLNVSNKIRQNFNTIFAYFMLIIERFGRRLQIILHNYLKMAGT